MIFFQIQNNNMAQFLLDTNMVSHILRRNPIVMERVNALHYSDGDFHFNPR